MVDAVIFDIDGTLWDASSSSAQGWNLGLAKLGIPGEVRAEEMSMVTGSPIEECVDALLPGTRVKHPRLLDTLSSCEEAMVGRAGGRFYEGALETVSELARDGERLLPHDPGLAGLRLAAHGSGPGRAGDGPLAARWML